MSNGGSERPVMWLVPSWTSARSAPTLAEERKSHFFTWFNLTPSCPPVPGADFRIWHCFRPSGDQFRPLVEVAVQTDANDNVFDRRIGIDRSFIDDQRNSPFARDIAKSFLQWALPEPVSGDVKTLIQRIADLAASGPPIIFGNGAVEEPATPDLTGGYNVYLGHSARVALSAGPAGLKLINVPGGLPDGVHSTQTEGSTPVPAAGGANWLLEGSTPVPAAGDANWLLIEVTAPPPR